MEATASATLEVKVLCEKCQQIYNYDAIIRASRSNFISSPLDRPEGLAEECVKDLKEKLKVFKIKDLGYKKCPKCSYIQSWMKESRKEEVGGYASMIVIVFSLVSCGLLSKILCLNMWYCNLSIWIWILIFFGFMIIFSLLVSFLITIGGKIVNFFMGSKNTTVNYSPQSGPLEWKMNKEPVVTVVEKIVE